MFGVARMVLGATNSLANSAVMAFMASFFTCETDERSCTVVG